MAIPSRQIGWSTQSNLLWTISKELERLSCVLSGGCSTTTTTSTTLAPVPFEGTVYWGEDAATACSLINPIYIYGGTSTAYTFCSSIYYYIYDVPGSITTNIFISDGLGNVKEVYYQPDYLLTSISECTACI